MKYIYDEKHDKWGPFDGEFKGNPPHLLYEPVQVTCATTAMAPARFKTIGTPREMYTKPYVKTLDNEIKDPGDFWAKYNNTDKFEVIKL